MNMHYLRDLVMTRIGLLRVLGVLVFIWTCLPIVGQLYMLTNWRPSLLVGGALFRGWHVLLLVELPGLFVYYMSIRVTVWLVLTLSPIPLLKDLRLLGNLLIATALSSLELIMLARLAIADLISI